MIEIAGVDTEVLKNIKKLKMGDGHATWPDETTRVGKVYRAR